MFLSRLLMLGFISLVCCSCFERVAVTDLAPVSSGVAQERPSYIVRKGDTLFSIAWKFDKDYKALAYLNHIDKDTPLKSGQKINLIKTNNSKRITYKKLAAKKSKDRAFKVKKKTVAHIAKKYKRSPKATSWVWPASGQVKRNFSMANNQKGIDIQGRIGSSVVAAKAGVVAYSGSGLRGYGNLVILRHSNNFLSAYAFNRKILVREGEKVKAKQKIAEMGVSKGHKGTLHFEIRRKGRPIDPLKYLIRH